MCVDNVEKRDITISPCHFCEEDAVLPVVHRDRLPIWLSVSVTIVHIKGIESPSSTAYIGPFGYNLAHFYIHVAFRKLTAFLATTFIETIP